MTRPVADVLAEHRPLVRTFSYGGSRLICSCGSADVEDSHDYVAHVAAALADATTHTTGPHQHGGTDAPECTSCRPAAPVDATLTDDQRQRLIGAADAALRVRRNILLLASHASGHRKAPHDDWCASCNGTERWPCPAVRLAAGPVLDAVADLPSQRMAAHAQGANDGA